MRTLPEFARPHLANNWYLFVGNPDDPEQEADMLARSPISRVDQIRTPLLVVQGANDVRVVQAESDNLVEALRGRGVEVEYLVMDDEGHGFVNPDNVIDMFRAVDRFLAEYLGGRRWLEPTSIPRSAPQRCSSGWVVCPGWCTPASPPSPTSL